MERPQMFRVLANLLLWTTAAQSQDRAGAFDYYVLSLSWSPSWCAREGDARQSPQCDADADFGWVLHGLWPQYESGWPQNCPSAMTPPSRGQTAAMADIMGTSGLAWHQWNKHGVCSGLDSTDYYRLARDAFEQITRPAVLRDLDRTVTLPASLIEEAFLRDNPALTADGLTVTCAGGHIQEVRICLTRDLAPRDCAPDTRRDCTMQSAIFEPVR